MRGWNYIQTDVQDQRWLQLSEIVDHETNARAEVLVVPLLDRPLKRLLNSHTSRRTGDECQRLAHR